MATAPTDRFGSNAIYVEALRAQWQHDPNSVPPEWRSFFSEGAPVGDPKGEPRNKSESTKEARDRRAAE